MRAFERGAEAHALDKRTAVLAMKPLHLHVTLAASNHLAMNGSRMTVMLFAASLGASPAVVGLLAAMYGVVSAFVAVAVGRWIDRVGPRRPILLASSMVTLGALVAGAWHELPALFVAAPLMGTFNSMFQMTTQQTVGRYGKPEDRPANFSLQSLAISTATFTGPVVAGLAIDHLGYGNSFFLMAAFGFAPIAVVWMGLLQLPPRREHPKETATPVSGWALLGDRELRRAYIAAASNNGIWSIWGFMLPLYGHSIGLSATRIGTLAACLAVATILVRIFTARLVRRFASWPLIVASHLMMGAGFLAMPFTANFLLLAAFAFLIGIGLGLSGPLSTAAMFDASPPDKVGEVIGLRMTMANLAQTLVPILSGAVGSALGVGPVFWTVAALLAADSWANRDKLSRR
ncbi:MAG: MFS transporter [Burkholderiales bacterium]|nr:MFS transporter [Burkholderiales bacterium]